MDVSEVTLRVAAIEACKDDDEMAHSMEDQLRQDVLKAIADGSCYDPMRCARLALATSEIDFCRWCA